MPPVKNNRFNTLIAVSFIVLASISRIALPSLFGHPGNFSPIDAIALFSGACFGRKIFAFIVPLLSIWVSDLFVDYGYYHKLVLFYPGFYWQYFSYLLIVLLGLLFSGALTGNKIARFVPSVIGSSLLASLLFFIVSNFGVWAAGYPHALYPHTAQGLMTCYFMAIPFFSHTLMSDMVYSSVLFGAYFAFRVCRPNPVFKQA